MPSHALYYFNNVLPSDYEWALTETIFPTISSGLKKCITNHVILMSLLQGLFIQTCVLPTWGVYRVKEYIKLSILLPSSFKFLTYNLPGNVFP